MYAKTTVRINSVDTTNDNNLEKKFVIYFYETFIFRTSAKINTETSIGHNQR